MEIKKRVALVTGASSGIGKATAIRLKEAGYIVYGAARRIEKMKALENQGIHILKLDVSDNESIESCIKEIISKFGQLDVLVNNAGFGTYGALEDVPIEEARYQFEVNLFGLARLTQLTLPFMRKHEYGKIVNISSIGGKVWEPISCWYKASKFALEGLSDCLRIEVKEFGIDVIIIEPGAIKTEFAEFTNEKVMKYSGHTVYQEMAQRVKNAYDKFISQSGSNPDVIAKVIEKSIRTKNPKTRYVAGRFAKSTLFMKRLLPDKWWDKYIVFFMKFYSKR
jgi:NAD(P)-dependent dehydrogenase (short-subunit alcohol dehydrogenase family)